MAQLAQENGTNFEEGVDVGNFLVNVFPISELVDSHLFRCDWTYKSPKCFIVRHIPAWFPGAGFRRTGIEWNKRLILAVNGTVDKVKAEMVSGYLPLWLHCTDTIGMLSGCWNCSPQFYIESLGKAPSWNYRGRCQMGCWILM